MADEKQLVYRMVNHQQFVNERTTQQTIKLVKTSSSTKLNHPYLHFCTQPNFNNRIFELIASFSLLIASLFGIGALGCWGLEIVDSSVIPNIENKYDWQTQKHICVGWMLLSLGSFIGSATFNHQNNQRL